MTVSDAIKVSTKDHIGTIVLNRPESRNAFTLEMLEECSTSWPISATTAKSG